MKAIRTIALLTLVFAATAVEAASVAVRVGRYSPRGASDLWAENVETFDITTDNFDYLFGGVELAVELSEFVDVAFGVDGYSRRVATNYRDYVRDDGTEIRQDLRLSVAPLTAGIRFLPVGKFHVVAPYVAGGFGLYPYEYREEGEFIDFGTYEVFGAVFRDSGVGAGGYAAAGVEVALSQGFLVFGEIRRHWVWAEHEGDFWDYGDFDLDAQQIGFGFTVRF